MGTESKFKTFRRLYVRNKFQTGLAVDIGAAKLSRVIFGRVGGKLFHILFYHHLQSSRSLSASPPLMLCLLYYGSQNISRVFCCSSTNLELSTCYDFHRIPQTRNNVMVACSLRCKTTDVLFTMAYRFVVPFVCTCMLVRPSEIYHFLLRN